MVHFSGGKKTRQYAYLQYSMGLPTLQYGSTDLTVQYGYQQKGFAEEEFIDEATELYSEGWEASGS